MHIKDKMQLMYSSPVNAWHEHVWFKGGVSDPVLNVARLDGNMEVYEKLGFDKLVMSLPVTNPKRCSAELFKAANIAVHDAMKRYPDSHRTEEMMYYSTVSAYKLASNSIESKQLDRYIAMLDHYYTFLAAYPESKYLKDLERMAKEARNFIDKNRKTEETI